MKPFRIILHSAVDLITNSSTVIFTYSEGSLQAVKDLVNEMLKVFGEDKSFDDLFYVEVFLKHDYYYYGDDEEKENFPQVEDKKEFLKETKLRVLKKEIPKPEWMVEAEESDTYYDGYKYPSVLEILTKDEKYSELASKLLKYLYSTDHEATRD
jgi:hypothetical protein